MGRNRRAAQQEAEAAAPTLESTLQLARLDLHAVLERLPDLWEDLYASVPRPRADAAQEHRPRDTAIVSPAHWTGTTRVQGVYMDVTAELARGHWVLGENTDVPMYWRWLYDCNHDPDTKMPLLTGPRAHTVELPELVKWTRVLDRSLEWLQAQDPQDFRPPEVNAIMEAAGHIRSARERIDKLWPPHENKRRCAVEDCKGKDGKPRVVRKGLVCETHVKRFWRAGKKAEAERRDELAEKRKGLRKAS